MINTKEYLDNPQPELITFKNKVFCLTVAFESGNRENYKELIRKCDGIIEQDVTKATNYLLIGNQGSKRYKKDCKGNKLEGAKRYKKMGLPLSIISESLCTKFIIDLLGNDFYHMLNNTKKPMPK
jgi:hypothetical protein